MQFKSHSVIHRNAREGAKKLMPINCGKRVSEHSGNQMHKSSDLALYNQEFTPKNQIGSIKSYKNQASQRSTVYNGEKWWGGGGLQC